LTALINLQSAQGSWDISNTLGSVLGIPQQIIESSLQQEGLSDSKRKCWATLLALAYLDLFFSENGSEWKLLADKATKWLSNQIDSLDTWKDKAKNVVKINSQFGC